MKRLIVVNNSIELWRQFRKTIDFRCEAYDKQLLDEIIKQLGFKPGCDIESELKRHNVSKEQLLAVLIKSLQPFSVMMSDLLKMFEDADAQYTDCTLEMKFDFESAEKLDLNLNKFRAFTEKVEKIALCEMQLESCKPWGDIVKPLKDIVYDVCQAKSIHHMIPEDISCWLDSYLYKETIWPEFSVLPPKSGIISFDNKISTLWEIPKSAIEKYRDCFDPELGRSMTLLNKSKDSLDFYQAETDFWIGSFIEDLCCLIYEIKNLQGCQDDEYSIRIVQDIEVKLDEYIKKLPVLFFSQDVLVKEFLDILHLPIWEKRHALYSAWVATQIISSFEDWNIEYHVQDGVLSFAFGGSEIAHLKKEPYDITLYAELRTLCNNPISKKRKNHIQPDYSLFIDDKDDPQNTVLVVECKQYKKANKRNFTEAVIDYTNGRPNSKVMLVNYTEIPESFRDVLPAEVSYRVPFFDELSPGCDGCDVFKKEVLNSVLKKSRINLSWGKSPTDLDLILIITDPDGVETAIDYNNRGNFTRSPYAWLDTDYIDGYGDENIVAYILPSYKYDVLVHNYSGEETEGEICVNAFINDVYELSLIRSTNLGVLEVWYVLSFDYLSAKVVNRDVPCNIEE